MATQFGLASQWDDLTRAGGGRSRRVSSSDSDWNGNQDWREIKPGGTLEVANVVGPGIIRHIWFTLNTLDLQYSRSCVLRMYWDDAEQPSVEAPLGDFFAVGHGLRLDVDSQAVSVTSEGRAYNCYWAMPFRKRARITLTNDSPRYAVSKCYYCIDYDEVDSQPDDALYFHARYRQEWPAKAGDYLVCETQGRGHYVGTVLSVQIRAQGWFGEGDDRIYIDGEERPGTRGTGTEDYFCDAWGFRTFMRPFYGVVLMEGFDFGDRLTVYRWHLRDPIRFQKSLKFMFEHKGSTYDSENHAVGSHSERSDFFSSVAFWYQSGVAKPFSSMPPLADRLVPSTMFELEKFVDQARFTQGAGKFIVQRGATYSGGAQLVINPDAADAIVRIPFMLKEDISGAGRLIITPSISSGVWRGHLDGQIIPKMNHVDFYSEAQKPNDINLGYVSLSKGEHELTFECVGKQAGARAWQLGLDTVRIEHVTRHFVQN